MALFSVAVTVCSASGYACSVLPAFAVLVLVAMPIAVFSVPDIIVAVPVQQLQCQFSRCSGRDCIASACCVSAAPDIIVAVPVFILGCSIGTSPVFGVPVVLVAVPVSALSVPDLYL